jgi:hypothetical protein
MTRWHESLDECIDRVARSMSAVAGEATVRARLEDGIDRLEAVRRRRPSVQWCALGLGATAAVIGALWLAPASDELVERTSSPPSDIALAPARDGKPDASRADVLGDRTRPTRAVERARSNAAHAPEEHRGLAALSLPETIDTGRLRLPPLALQPVQIEPLTLPRPVESPWIATPESKE